MAMDTKIQSLISLEITSGTMWYAGNRYVCYHEVEKRIYLNFKLDNIWRLNSCIVLYYAGLVSKVVAIVHRVTEHTICAVRNPSALHVVVPYLLPTHIQILQGFQDFRHYFTGMSPRLLDHVIILSIKLVRYISKA